MDLNQLKTDELKEEEGVWVDLDDDTRILIARLGNSKYRQAFQKYIRPHRAAMRAGTISEEQGTEVLLKALSEGILLGWEKLEENGQEIKFSPKEAYRVLKAYRGFRDVVAEAANMEELFKAEEIQTSGKSSKSASSGSSSGEKS